MQPDSTSSLDSSWVDLSLYDNADYDPGRSATLRSVWYFVSLLIFESGWFPLIRPKVAILRLFGARIGKGLVIKPNVRIKYPWRFQAGDNCWIGQDVWIDNLAEVQLGNHVCLSQRAYLCTGGHDHRRRAFDLITAPIEIGVGVWVGTTAIVLGGVRIGSNAIVGAASLVNDDVQSATIVGGVPARLMGHRRPPEMAEESSIDNSADTRAAYCYHTAKN